MKFAFSTLGCPDWEWYEILAAAGDLGYNGIEIRGLGKELYAPKMTPFLAKNIEETKAKMASLGVNISCLTSACHLFADEDREEHQKIGRDYIDLASRLGSPYVRVLGDANPQPEDDVDIDLVLDNLLPLADYAKGKNVTILVESNGAFADSNLLLDLMNIVDRPEVGVLWDVHHPYRFCLEPVTQTYNNLKPYIRYLHMKDSVMNKGQLVYKMMGEGDIPNREILQMLAADQFSGYVSLEWVKRWNKNLTEAGIVFPHYINYVQAAIGK